MKNEGINTMKFLLIAKIRLVCTAVFCLALTAHAQDGTIRLPGALNGLIRDLANKSGVNASGELSVVPSSSGGDTSNAGTSSAAANNSPSISGAAPASLEGGDSRFSFFMSEVKETKAEIDKYTSPKERLYLIPTKFEPYLLYAISKSARTQWMNGTAMTAAQKQAMDAQLDAIATAAAQKLPLFQPDDSKFAHGSAQEKALLKTEIKDLAQLTIHKIGVKEADWVIVKNNYGIPLYRNKTGYVLVKAKSAEHPYCEVLQIDIDQSYQGGGGYGSSRAKFDHKWISGCPK